MFSRAADTVETLLARIEANVLVGEKLELDAAQGALADLAGSVRRLAPEDQVASVDRLLNLVSDCDRLIAKLNRDLDLLRGASEAVNRRAVGVIAYAKGTHR